MKKNLTHFALGLLLLLLLAAAYPTALLRNWFTTHTDAEIQAVQAINVTLPPYNAPNDGTNDATDAIQAALDFVSTNTPSRTLYFPNGNYKITRMLVGWNATMWKEPQWTELGEATAAPWYQRSSPEIVGESQYGTRLFAASNIPAILLITNWPTGSSIRKMQFDGCGMATNGLETIRFAFGSTYQDLAFRSNVMSGIKTTQAEGSTFNNCHFWGLNYEGDPYGSNGSNTVYGIWFTRLNTYFTNLVTTNVGYNVSDRVTVRDCFFSRNKIGIVMQASAAGLHIYNANGVRDLCHAGV